MTETNGNKWTIVAAVAAVFTIAALNLGAVQYMAAPLQNEVRDLRTRADRHESQFSHSGIGREIADRLARIETRLDAIEKIAKQFGR